MVGRRGGTDDGELTGSRLAFYASVMTMAMAMTTTMDLAMVSIRIAPRGVRFSSFWGVYVVVGKRKQRIATHARHSYGHKRREAAMLTKHSNNIHVDQRQEQRFIEHTAMLVIMTRRQRE